MTGAFSALFHAGFLAGDAWFTLADAPHTLAMTPRSLAIATRALAMTLFSASGAPSTPIRAPNVSVIVMNGVIGAQFVSFLARILPGLDSVLRWFAAFRSRRGIFGVFLLLGSEFGGWHGFG